MKILLINPPWQLKEGNIWRYIKSSMPPLGLLYLAAYLEEKGYNCDIIDFQATGAPWEEVERSIAASDYDVYGITATTPLAYNAYRISALIRERKKDARIVLGGVHPTALPEEALTAGGADFVVRGEGEEIFHRIVRGDAPELIDGISYIKDGKAVHVGPAGLVNDLDSLPYPAFHKINLKLYRPAVGAYKRTPAINMTTTRGCPGGCTFCNSASVKLRKRSAGHIYGEIKMLTEKYGIREICFYDDTFTVYGENISKLCKLLLVNKIDITWSCFARADCVNGPMLSEMNKAGCHQVMYGIESANEQILANIKKRMQKDKHRSAIELAKKNGITVRCTFMLGNPGETQETIDETINYAIALDPDIALFNITVPYPGTEMFAWASEHGFLLTRDWRDYDLSMPVMSLPDAPVELLKKKYKTAFRKFYFRPKYIMKQARRYMSPREFPLLLEGMKNILKFAKS